MNEEYTEMHKGKKQRHGCLTAWLALITLASLASAAVYFLSPDLIRETIPDMPSWSLPVLGVLGLLNLLWIYGLFQWKKWGFWGFIGSSIAALVVNLLSGIPPAQAFSGVIGLVLLYGVLQIGKENKGWPQLD